jgi:hypothetical protein
VSYLTRAPFHGVRQLNEPESAWQQGHQFLTFEELFWVLKKIEEDFLAQKHRYLGSVLRLLHGCQGTSRKLMTALKPDLLALN